MGVSRIVLAPGRLKAFHREAVEDKPGRCAGQGKGSRRWRFAKGNAVLQSPDGACVSLAV